MSSHEPPEQERRGPSGLTMQELAALLPPLEPLPGRELAPERPPTPWRVVPWLLFSIFFGALAAAHAGIYLLRAGEPLKESRCLALVSSAGVFTITALLCALVGAGLLSKLKQALRDRRAGRHDSRHDSRHSAAASFRSPERG
jgi:hypothetical protein